MISTRSVLKQSLKFKEACEDTYLTTVMWP